MRTRIGRCLLNQIGDQRKHIQMTVGTTPQSELQQGITGLETAIILIAFVVVMSAFAFTGLSTGIFSPERSKDTAYAGLSEARSSLVTRGSFGGFAGKVSTTEAPYKFSFVVASAIGSSDPIDLTPPYTATIPGQTRTSFRGLHTGSRLTTRASITSCPTSQGPSHSSATATQKTCWMTMRRRRSTAGSWTGTRRLRSVPTDLAYMDGSGDGGGAGGMTSSDTVLTISDKFTIEILAEGGAVLAIERKLPDVFKDVMDLR